MRIFRVRMIVVVMMVMAVIVPVVMMVVIMIPVQTADTGTERIAHFTIFDV